MALPVTFLNLSVPGHASPGNVHFGSIAHLRLPHEGRQAGLTRRRPPDRRDRILDAAERMARRGGYHGFSFREVAAAVGVKSASIHHHFPTKEDMATELATRYVERFIAGLVET